MLLYCELVLSWSLAPIVKDWRGPSSTPLAWLTLAAASAVRISSRLNPYEANAVGLAWIRTAGFCPPLIETSPTPGSCEIFCANEVSARSSTLDKGRESEVSARVKIGASAGLTLL